MEWDKKESGSYYANQFSITTSRSEFDKAWEKLPTINSLIKTKKAFDERLSNMHKTLDKYETLYKERMAKAVTPYAKAFYLAQLANVTSRRNMTYILHENGEGWTRERFK